CGLGLEESSLDPLLALAVHAIDINRLAELVENGDAHSKAFLPCFGHTGLRDLLGSGDVQHVLLEHDFRRIASDEKLIALSSQHGADYSRECCNSRESNISLHGIPPCRLRLHADITANCAEKRARYSPSPADII